MSGQWTKGCAKIDFKPETWVFCHENSGRTNSYKPDVDHLAKINALVKFKLEAGLIKFADLDTLKQVVTDSAKFGAKKIHVYRLDNITLLQSLSAPQLGRDVSRLGCHVSDSRIGSPTEVEIKPEAAVIAALEPNSPKMHPCENLSKYIEALTRWAISSDEQNARQFKRAYHKLHNVIEKHRSEPDRVQAVAQEIKDLVTGAKVQVGTEGQMADRYGSPTLQRKHGV